MINSNELAFLNKSNPIIDIQKTTPENDFHPATLYSKALKGKVFDERDGFSQRLTQALYDARYISDSPTQLAKEFNKRFTGNSVTIHATRKWLIGEAIPTQEKIRVLSNWLGVTAEWLRFGSEKIPESNTPSGDLRFETKEMRLISDLKNLDEYHRVIAREFVRSLTKICQQNKEDEKEAA